MNAMQTGEFVAAFREAFGPVPELPLLFRYTDEPLRPAAKAGVILPRLQQLALRLSYCIRGWTSDVGWRDCGFHSGFACDIARI